MVIDDSVGQVDANRDENDRTNERGRRRPSSTEPPPGERADRSHDRAERDHDDHQPAGVVALGRRSDGDGDDRNPHEHDRECPPAQCHTDSKAGEQQRDQAERTGQWLPLILRQHSRADRDPYPGSGNLLAVVLEQHVHDASVGMTRGAPTRFTPNMTFAVCVGRASARLHPRVVRTPRRARRILAVA
jgi:hypothetical protein